MTKEKKVKKPNFTLQLETEEETVSRFEKTQEVPEWHNTPPEGELAVDVVSEGENIVIISTIAGAETNEIEVNIHNDLLTIRGVREAPISMNSDYEFYHRECYWGPFSRTVVLPVDIEADLAYAEYQNGILKVYIPIKETNREIPINVIEE